MKNFAKLSLFLFFVVFATTSSVYSQSQQKLPKLYPTDKLVIEWVSVTRGEESNEAMNWGLIKRDSNPEFQVTTMISYELRSTFGVTFSDTVDFEPVRLSCHTPSNEVHNVNQKLSSLAIPLTKSLDYVIYGFSFQEYNTILSNTKLDKIDLGYSVRDIVLLLALNDYKPLTYTLKSEKGATAVVEMYIESEVKHKVETPSSQEAKVVLDTTTVTTAVVKTPIINKKTQEEAAPEEPAIKWD